MERRARHAARVRRFDPSANGHIGPLTDDEILARIERDVLSAPDERRAHDGEAFIFMRYEGLAPALWGSGGERCDLAGR